MNRRWIEILTSNKDGQIYSVMAWTPLKPGGKGVSAIARRGASVLPKLDETDLGAFNIPHVRVPVVFSRMLERNLNHIPILQTGTLEFKRRTCVLAWKDV